MVRCLGGALRHLLRHVEQSEAGEAPHALDAGSLHVGAQACNHMHMHMYMCMDMDMHMHMSCACACVGACIHVPIACSATLCTSVHVRSLSRSSTCLLPTEA